MSDRQPDLALDQTGDEDKAEILALTPSQRTDDIPDGDAGGDPDDELEPSQE